MPKKYLQILAALILTLGLGGVYALWSKPKLEFAYYKTLAAELISDADYRKLIEIHRDCFEETKRRNLLKYLTKYQAQSFNLDQKVNRMIEEGRLEQIETFHNTKNVYVTKLDSQIIGLFNCREEQEITDSSMMIFNVCLRTGMRGKGFGEQMMHHAHQNCRRDSRDITLTVYKDDEKVVNFYKKLNYSIVSNLEAWDHDFTYFNKYLMKWGGEKP